MEKVVLNKKIRDTSTYFQPCFFSAFFVDAKTSVASPDLRRFINHVTII